MISVTINGKAVTVEKGTSILEACRRHGVFVPTLCNHPSLPPSGECGVCVVKINQKKMVSACATKCIDGMVVETDSKEVKQMSINNLQEFIPQPMLTKTPEIEDLWKYYTGKDPKPLPPQSNCSITWDPEKCIFCNKCVRACDITQQIDAIDPTSHAFSDQCIKCGHCITVCPVNALYETPAKGAVLSALTSNKICILQTAPSVRVSVGEGFGDSIGTVCTGKIIEAARKMGFKYVFDINYGADQTIIEEGTEFIERLQGKGKLPVFTSCCPGWVNFCEKKHHELLDNLSTSKSPHMMSGVAIKQFLPQKTGISADDIFLVSLMPCTSKKDEILREQHKGTVDAVITTNEFIDLVKQFQINWKTINESKFDDMYSESTGAAAIFGVTGGVAEAALRFCVEKLTKQKLGPIVYSELRGFEGIKYSTIPVNGRDVRIAIINGIGNAEDFISENKTSEFDFIEVMACPGGCIGGGGQPVYKSTIKPNTIISKRAQAIYEIDEQKQSEGEITTNDNKALIKMYQDFVGEVGGPKAKQLFHTHYSPK